MSNRWEVTPMYEAGGRGIDPLEANLWHAYVDDGSGEFLCAHSYLEGLVQSWRAPARGRGFFYPMDATDFLNCKPFCERCLSKLRELARLGGVHADAPGIVAALTA